MPRPDFPKAIDSTIRSAFVACPRKCYNRFLQHLVPDGADETNPHTHAGQVVAKGIEVFRRTYWGQGESRRTALACAGMAMIVHWGETDIFDEGHEHEQKGLLNCLAAVGLYFRDPESDPIKPHRSRLGVMVEFTFSIPMGVEHPQTGEEIRYFGRFDMIGRFRNSLWVVDEKTTKSLGSGFGSRFDLRGQFTSYVWAARQFGYPVEGAIVRGIGLRKMGIDFATVPISVAKWEEERWLDQLRRDVERMKRCWSEGYWDYALDEACNAYGGCEFKPLCMSPKPERYLDFYKEQVWNPLEEG